MLFVLQSMQEEKIKDIELHSIQKHKHLKPITIRTTKEISEWMGKNKVSPTRLFNKAAMILMRKQKTQEDLSK